MADFPTSVPSITNPTANDTLAAVPHHEQHEHANDNLAAIGTKLGTGSSTPTAGALLTGSGTGTSSWGYTPASIGTGDAIDRPGSTTLAQLVRLRRGTAASPDGNAHPLVKIEHTATVDDAGIVGDGSAQLSSFMVFRTAGGVNQPVAIYGRATSTGTATGSDGRYPDATAGYFVGETLGASAIGRGIGLFARGYSTSTLGRADGMQVVAANGSGSPHSVHPTGISSSTGAWVCATDGRGGAGIQIGNGFGRQFDVAFHVNGQTSASPTATVQTASVANPTVITTTAAHGLENGDQVVITGSNSTPTIDGTYTATVTGTTTFTIPVNVTVQGTAGSITGRIGAALTAAFRDDSNSKSAVQIRGSHSVAAINLAESVGGPSVWLPQFNSTTYNGAIIATNSAGNGTVGILDYNSSGVLHVGRGAESSISLDAFTIATAGGIGLGKTTTTGLLAVNNAGNGYVRMLDYDGSILTLGAGSEGTIYSAKYHTFAAGIYVGAGDIVTDTTTGTKIGTSTSQKLGFWNAPPVVKGTVTGSRGGNAALASLLTLLASYGLLTDSSS